MKGFCQFKNILTPNKFKDQAFSEFGRKQGTERPLPELSIFQYIYLLHFSGVRVVKKTS